MPKKINYCPRNRAKPSTVKKHWVVPASWLLEQAELHLRGSDHNVIFASDGRELWIYGYKEVPPGGKQGHREDPAPHGVPWGPAGPMWFWRGGDGGAKAWFEDWPEPKPGT